MGIFNYHWNIKIDVALQNYSIGIKSTPIKLKHKQWMICNIKERRPRCGGASFFINHRLRIISPPWRMASSLAGSIFHARSGSDFFRPTITFSIATTGRTLR